MISPSVRSSRIPTTCPAMSTSRSTSRSQCVSGSRSRGGTAQAPRHELQHRGLAPCRLDATSGQAFGERQQRAEGPLGKPIPFAGLRHAAGAAAECATGPAASPGERRERRKHRAHPQRSRPQRSAIRLSSSTSSPPMVPHPYPVLLLHTQPRQAFPRPSADRADPLALGGLGVLALQILPLLQLASPSPSASATTSSTRST